MSFDRKAEFQEQKEHGNRLFPFDIYPCSIPKDFPTVALHWQKSMELIFVKKGRGQVQLGMEVMTAQAGDIFVVPPGTLHALRLLPGNVMEYENFIFDIDFLGGGAVDICAQEFLVPLQAGQLLPPMKIGKKDERYSEPLECLHQVEELCKWKANAFQLGVKAYMLQFLYILIKRNPETPQADNPDKERLKLVLQRVEKEFDMELTVPEMADFCGCSNSHFMRWFKKMTGTSFTTYLNERRLAAAAEALRQSDDKILTIAQNAGFTNLSNFNRQFLARYGVTPREYRG